MDNHGRFADRGESGAVRMDGVTVHGDAYQIGRVHGGITVNINVPPTARTRQAEPPDDVPGDLSGFVNRIEELARLALWLDAGTTGAVAAALVSGLPGVGKRATVRRLAQSVRERFPDGQLYVDFAVSAGGVGGNAAEALAVCLKRLGQAEEYLPNSVEDRLLEYRRLSGGRRLLVVLENVTEPSQVRMLTPKGAGSAVVATSDLQLGELRLDKVRLMKLAPLDDAACLELLAVLCEPERVEAEPDAARGVVQLCAGLPVALHLVAARLAMQPHLTLAAVAHELSDESARLSAMTVRTTEGESSVSSAFELAYRTLTPDQAGLYRVLGVLPTPSFDAGAVAAAVGAETSAVQLQLAELVRTSLLEATPDGRYHLHDLVRLHARQCAQRDATEEERAEAVRRLVTHYLALTALADRAIRADRLRIADLRELLRDAPDPFAQAGPAAGRLALAWLEAERASILAVLRAGLRHGLYRQTWQLAEAFTALFLHHRHLGDWRESLQLGVDAAVADDNGKGDPAAEARLRSLLSRPLLDLGEDDRASRELETAVLRADESGRLLLRASVQEFLGRYWERRDPTRAVAVFEESLRLNREVPDRRGAAVAGFFLGCALDADGRTEEAAATLRWVIEEFDSLADEDRRMAARALAALGRVRARLGDTDGARSDLERAVEALRATDASHYEARTRIALADLLEGTTGDRGGARGHLVRALEIFEQGGSPDADELRRRIDGG
ncbi:NB-ARC domain-containing protein [Kitasatospora sp. MAP5-34]|uniref:NB-ARC domain-containing protein n=1 Tax=Kitasatospora sp. MAP5-34 TaxID=3035102 RepID=UPI002474C4F1|nr:NB-ARC domain-containing protein [Kitasatospora sp. MAP5-34]MDH6577704.1 tetratricopeptide (TPR) repeat protein [Kitasatospora sp. MAP5-34]